MNLSLSTLICEIIVESKLGKKFPIQIQKNGRTQEYMGIASANAKPNERPYRITWFTPDLMDNRHVDLELEEVMSILNEKQFPAPILLRIKKRYPNDDSELIGDSYTIKM